MLREKIKYSFLLWVAVGTLITSCKPLQPIALKKVNEAKIAGVSMKGIDATILATIDNPNKMSFKIYSTALHVKINEIDLGQVQLKNNAKIKGRGEHQTAFSLHADLPALNMGLLAQAAQLSKSKDANVHVKGTITVGKFLFRKTIPVDVKSRVPIQR